MRLAMIESGRRSANGTLSAREECSLATRAQLCGRERAGSRARPAAPKFSFVGADDLSRGGIPLSRVRDRYRAPRPREGGPANATERFLAMLQIDLTKKKRDKKNEKLRRVALRETPRRNEEEGRTTLRGDLSLR